MAHRTSNGVMQTSATTGTGALALDSAPPAYKNFGTVMSVGDTCHYSVMTVDTVGRPTGEYERGRGTYSAVNVLSRTTVIESSNADAAVNFAGTNKLVMMTILAPNGAQVVADWMAALGAASLSGAAFYGPAYCVPQSVPYAANVALNAGLSNTHVIGTLTGNLTLALPTNWGGGQTLSIRFQQDGNGGRVVTLPNFKVSGGLETGANRATWLHVTHVPGIAYEGNWSYVAP